MEIFSKRCYHGPDSEGQDHHLCSGHLRYAIDDGHGRNRLSEQHRGDNLPGHADLQHRHVAGDVRHHYHLHGLQHEGETEADRVQAAQGCR